MEKKRRKKKRNNRLKKAKNYKMSQTGLIANMILYRRLLWNQKLESSLQSKILKHILHTYSIKLDSLSNHQQQRIEQESSE